MGIGMNYHLRKAIECFENALDPESLQVSLILVFLSLQNMVALCYSYFQRNVNLGCYL